MTCEIVKPLLSEFGDDTLNASIAWQVQTHLSECAACGQISRELRSLRHALTALPTRQPSAQFEASLAQRLALTRRPEVRRTWRDKLAQALEQTFRGPRPFLRPAIALGLALTAVVSVSLLPLNAPLPVAPAAAVTHSMDRSFVADCVAQHGQDAAAEPLADLAAQNLAGHLDNSAPATATPPFAADAGLF